MRKVLAAILFAIAGALVLLAFAALENLWAEYQDSPDSTYIELAAIELALAAGATIGGAFETRFGTPAYADAPPSLGRS
jgi:hypothetical protein